MGDGDSMRSYASSMGSQASDAKSVDSGAGSSIASFGAISQSSAGSNSNVSGAVSQFSLASQASSEEGGGMEKLDIYMMRAGEIRQLAHQVSNSTAFGNSLLFIIFMNTIVLALQTEHSVNDYYGNTCVTVGFYLGILDSVFLGIYLFEAIIKIFATRLYYFKSGWNQFDFFIVIVSIVIWILPELLVSNVHLDAKIFRILRLFRVVRAFRAFRALKSISFFKSLHVIIRTILKSLPALSNIVLLSMLVLYIFAVIGATTFVSADRDTWGSMGSSIFRLFSLLTFDNWTSYYQNAKKEDAAIWGFLAVFIIIQSFFFINLFIAVIVNNLEESHEQLKDSKKKKKTKRKDDPALQEATQEALDNLRKQTSWRKTVMEWQNQLELGSLKTYYPDGLANRERVLYAKYYMLLTLLDLETNVLQDQQQVLDGLVDLAKDAEERASFN